MANRISIAVLFIFVFTNSFSQFMWQIKEDTVISWTYHDGDEFNSATVDEEKWTPAYSYSQVNYRFDYFMTPKRLVFENGVCKFVCDRDTGLYKIPDWQLDSAFKKEYSASIVDGDKFRYLYSCGNVWSKKDYGKGYFEIRFKTTDSYGMWPAFWLYGTNQKDEIDFFELKGERDKSIHVATHCPHGCDSKYKRSGLIKKPFSGWVKVNKSLSGNYNVLAGEWQDGYVKWYLNGEGIAFFEGEFSSQLMSLIIGTGPAKDGYGFAPGVNSKSYFPNSLDVDYVRVWYKSGSEQQPVKGKRQTSFDYYATNDQPAALKKKIRFMYDKKSFGSEEITISVLPSHNNEILITSLGKSVGYDLEVYNESGEKIYSDKITSFFTKIPVKENSKVRLVIKHRFKTIEQWVSTK